MGKIYFHALKIIKSHNMRITYTVPSVLYNPTVIVINLNWYTFNQLLHSLTQRLFKTYSNTSTCKTFNFIYTSIFCAYILHCKALTFKPTTCFIDNVKLLRFEHLELNICSMLNSGYLMIKSTSTFQCFKSVAYASWVYARKSTNRIAVEIVIKLSNKSMGLSVVSTYYWYYYHWYFNSFPKQSQRNVFFYSGKFLFETIKKNTVSNVRNKDPVTLQHF